MRIIAGSRRGKKLQEYYTATTRPTTDRVKENVFNVLSNYLDITRCQVLDLFAGTGAYGVECLSRGARFVRFNDHDPQALKVVRANIGGIWSNCRLSGDDYLTVLAEKEKYDLIFLDPPYDSDFGERAVEQIEHGLIVYETDREFTHPNLVAVKKYGRARVYFLKK